MEGLKTYLGSWFSAVEADEHVEEELDNCQVQEGDVKSAVDALI